MKKFISFFLLLAFFVLNPCNEIYASALGSNERIPIFPDDWYADEVTSSPENKYAETPINKFQVSNLTPEVNTDYDYVDWWYSEWEDCHYIFLPAAADRSQLNITYETKNNLPVCLNSESADTTGILARSDDFNITVGDTDCGTLKIMQSDLGCIFLHTSSFGLDRLDSDRNFTETGTALMLNSDGDIEYNGKLEKITSHGNSSWDYSKKKSYNFKLPQKENIFDMGKAKKWALISNFIDHSMLRNATAIELSKKSGIEYAVDYRFVDVYADGSYRGTYQLCERIEIQKNRVNINNLEERTEKLNKQKLCEYKQVTVGADSPNDYIENSYKYFDIPNDPADITGGYLLEFQLWNRYGSKAKSGFVTSKGQAIEIKGPEYASESQVLYIRQFIQDLEDAIYSGSGYNSKGRHYSDYIDVDSLIRAYLVQEITMNIDGTFASFYLWKDSDVYGDGKIHFSPVWDFDLSCNNFPTHYCNSDGVVSYSYKTNNLFVANFPIHGYSNLNESDHGSGRATYGISWVGQLFKNEKFVERAAELYFFDFDDNLEYLLNYGLSDMEKAIKLSAEMNNARWHTYGSGKFCVFGAFNGNNHAECVSYVRTFLESRRTFLRNLWIPYIDTVEGDVNMDGSFDIADVVTFQKWLLCFEDAKLKNWKSADLCHDDLLDVFDLCLMKRKLINSY